jgi:hypothetical protein
MCFGRKIRWGENLGAPWIRFSPGICRAGFELCRGRPTSQRFEATKTDHTLGDATCTHGSNPARLRHGWWRPQSAPRSSPYRSSAHKLRNIELGDPALGAAEFLKDGYHQFCAAGIKFGMLGVPARVSYPDGRAAAVSYLNENRVEAL